MDKSLRKSIIDALTGYPEDVQKTLYLVAEFLPKDAECTIKLFTHDGPVECCGHPIQIAHRNPQGSPAVKLEEATTSAEPVGNPIEKLGELCKKMAELPKKVPFEHECEDGIWEDALVAAEVFEAIAECSHLDAWDAALIAGSFLAVRRET